MSSPIETQVVIVGGSIVGLATSAFLAQRKVPHVLIEKHTGPAAHPKAVGFTTRTIELLRMIGSNDKVKGKGFTRPPRRAVVESLAGKWDNEKHWGAQKPQGPPPGDKPGQTGPPGPPGNTDGLSPVIGVAISQDKMEPVFREYAVEHGADHRQGWRVASCSQDESGVLVIANNKAGEELKVHGKYLIAADGAASPIRKSLDIGRKGVGTMRTIHSTMFRCATLDKHLETGFSQFEIKNKDIEAFQVLYPDGRWALQTFDPNHKNLSETQQRDMIRSAAGEDIPDSDIELIAPGNWDLAALISDKFQSGRIFLAGDAAHCLPPTRGGYGANTGIADGHDLAWKLAAVLSGESRPSLLETYDAERRPIALTRHDQIFARPDYNKYLQESEWKLPEGTIIIDDTAMELGQLYRSSAILGAEDPSLPTAQRPDEWDGQPGTRAAHFWLTHAGERKSILDLFYTTWVVLSHDERWAKATQAASEKTGVRVSFVQIGGSNGENIEEDQGAFRRLYGVDDSGAVLVRPDGYVAWRSKENLGESEIVLASALATVAHAARGH